MAKNLVTAGQQSNNDNTQYQARGTKDGAITMQPLHGIYYEQAMRGNVFHASTIIAGKVVLVAAATLAGVFTIHNPVGSGKNLELISFTWGPTSATDVVNTVGMLIQRNLSAGAGVPTSTTQGSVHRLGLAGVANVGLFYSVATLTNVAIPGAVGSVVPIPFYPLMSNGATSDTNAHDLRHEFKGKVILEPDSLISICTNVTTATIATMAMDWAEYVA